MTFSHKMSKGSACRTEPPLPPDCVLNELLQIHLLLPQGSKWRAALHQAFAANVQLDLAHSRPDAPAHMVLKLALIFHEVWLHDHWKEEGRGIWRQMGSELWAAQLPGSLVGNPHQHPIGKWAAVLWGLSAHLHADWAQPWTDQGLGVRNTSLATVMVYINSQLERI